MVREAPRQDALAPLREVDQAAPRGCMKAFGMTYFRNDIAKTTLSTLGLHSDADGIVPLEGSGRQDRDRSGGAGPRHTAG